MSPVWSCLILLVFRCHPCGQNCHFSVFCLIIIVLRHRARSGCLANNLILMTKHRNNDFSACFRHVTHVKTSVKVWPLLKHAKTLKNTEITTFRVVRLWTGSDIDFRAFPYEEDFYPIRQNRQKVTLFVTRWSQLVSHFWHFWWFRCFL